MTHVIRSRLPGGQPWVTARLRCDGCRAWGPGPIGTDDMSALMIVRARLRILAARRLGWSIRDVRHWGLSAGDAPRTARVDYCPACLDRVRSGAAKPLPGAES